MSFPKPTKADLKAAFRDHGVNFTEHAKCNLGRNAWTSGLRASTVHHTAGKNSADYLASFNYGGANTVINHGEYNGRQHDGRAVILCWGSAWHSGAGGPWTGVAAKDSLHLVSWGIEIESLGTRKDMTDKQIETVGRMLAALVDLGMPKGNIHRHADWTDGTGPVRGASSATRGRKMDTNKRWYDTAFWVKQAGLYVKGPAPETAVPAFAELVRASTTPGDVSIASHRLATRLHQLGFYTGTVQPRGEQGYPTKAVTAFQHARMREEEGKGYTGPTHKGIWGVRP